MIRKLVVFLWALTTVLAAHAAPQAVATAAEVNSAGELRMLSQRLAKAYAQRGLEVTPAVALEQLQDSIKRVERSLERLRPLVTTVPSAAAPYERLVAEWSALRAVVAEPADKERALLASRRSLAVLESADRFAAALESAVEDGRAHAVNQAGRLRMLSQRAAKAYMLYSWGAETAASRREMESASDEFRRGLTALAALPDNTAETRSGLAEIALQWEWLRTALSVEGAGSYRLVVAEAADSILVATDHLVRLYEQPAAR